MSCSTRRIPSPGSSTTWRRMTPKRSLSAESSPEDGSSKSRMRKSAARTRASSTRRRWPVGSVRSAARPALRSRTGERLTGPLAHLGVVSSVGEEVAQWVAVGQGGFVGQGHVLGHGQRVEELHALERAPEPPPGPHGWGRPGQIPAAQLDPARRDRHDARAGVEQRRLPRAVRSDESTESPRLAPASRARRGWRLGA